MANYLAQVILQHTSALPEDRFINTYSFFAATARDVPTAEAISTSLSSVYTTIDNWLSSSIQPLVTVKFYDRSDPQPRQPFYTDQWTITLPSGAKLPEEVALCMSFTAAPVSGVPAGRRRGRVFIGPLNTAALNIGEGGNGSRPLSDLVENLAQAGATLVEQSQAAASWTWQVWSGVDLAGREVVNGWVDDAFDTQRRRGLAPTSRLAFPL